jgi:hypothetical protein
MITIHDLQGTRHDKCPRCNGEWRSLIGRSGLLCANNCGIGSGNYGQLGYQIHCLLGAYVVYWGDKSCYVRDGFGKESSLPCLPYDITWDRIRNLLNYL